MLQLVKAHEKQKEKNNKENNKFCKLNLSAKEVDINNKAIEAVKSTVKETKA